MLRGAKLSLPDKQSTLLNKHLDNYKNVKSMLGHISVADDNILPVPIYCLCIAENDELIFTGDNNG